MKKMKQQKTMGSNLLAKKIHVQESIFSVAVLSYYRTANQ
jgi:hypothetical protein